MKTDRIITVTIRKDTGSMAREFPRETARGIIAQLELPANVKASAWISGNYYQAFRGIRLSVGYPVRDRLVAMKKAGTINLSAIERKATELQTAYAEREEQRAMSAARQNRANAEKLAANQALAHRLGVTVPIGPNDDVKANEITARFTGTGFEVRIWRKLTADEVVAVVRALEVKP